MEMRLYARKKRWGKKRKRKRDNLPRALKCEPDIRMLSPWTDWPTAPLGIVRAVQTFKPQAVEDFPGFAKANGGSRIMVEGEEAKDGSTRHAVTAAPP
ncbi:hypothetical protein BDV35DRAFT_384760 [Aspergillus flavus]|uniref:Uncharacterized protein n=1 Tax=Aspergillus flavus TaxID=5059 RepID=A0A5N6GMJ8_ASPFL|nr:hypothetical protein BDV35DRAFT_384760 [Aspergillus flavus]